MTPNAQFWLGFAVCGWIYMGLSVVPSIESRLVTTKALAYLDSKVPGRSGIFHIARWSYTKSGVPTNQVQNVAVTKDRNQLGLLDAVTGKLLGG